MSYQIPQLVRILQLRDASIKVPLILVTPEDDVKLKHVIVSMYLQGLQDPAHADAYMKINVYSDEAGSHLLMSSTNVLLSDIPRDQIGKYCEQRFDLPALNNLMNIGHTYLVEFEAYGTHTMDENNYIGLIIDHDSPLATLNEGEIVIRQSSFFEKL